MYKSATTTPCCKTTYCGPCIRQKLFADDYRCPHCTTSILIQNLEENKILQKLVDQKKAKINNHLNKPKSTNSSSSSSSSSTMLNNSSMATNVGSNIKQNVCCCGKVEIFFIFKTVS